MKQKVLVCAGSSAFEFEGEILELEPDYLVLRANHGDIYIERKYLVFIQFLNEEKEPDPAPVPVRQPKPPQVDAAARFVNKRLKHDPVDETFEELIMPPSQLRDDDDGETVRQIERLYGKPHPVTQPENLADAVRSAMSGGDEDFSMGTGGSQYNNPAQTILGRKNANNKKS
jgi:hypothetical protein